MKPAAYAETEVKIYVNNLEAVAGRLQAAGAILLTPRVFERNIRYENADESLTARGIIVRLRQDHRNRLTYKEPSKAHEDGLTTRFEAEVEIDNSASRASTRSRAASSRPCTGAASGRCASTPVSPRRGVQRALPLSAGPGQTGLSVAFDLPTQIGYDATTHGRGRGRQGGRAHQQLRRHGACCSTGSRSTRSAPA
jgi:hypothetical protein